MSIAIEVLNAALEMFVVIFFFNQMLNNREINKIFYLIFIFSVLSVHILRSFIPLNTYTNIGITCILWGLLIIVLYDDLLLKKLLSFVLYFVSVLITDIFCRFIMTCMINSTYGAHSTTPGLERYIGMTLTNVLLFSILSLFAITSKNKRMDITFKYKIMMLLSPIFSLFIIINLDIFIMLSGTNNIKYIFALLFIVVGLLYFNIMTFEFMDTCSANVRLAATEEIIKNQYESYQLLEINENELRKLRHNIKEHMEVIKEMISYNVCEVSVELSNSIEKLSSIQTSLVYTGDVAIDAILNVEAKKASNSGIKYLVKIQNLVYPINIAAIDKSTILCNTINNAIEACQKNSEKERFIVIYISSTRDKVRIHIENSSPPLNIRNNHIYSTKKDVINHGLGLESVKNSLKKYNGYLDISYSDGITVCSMLFDNPEEKIHA